MYFTYERPDFDLNDRNEILRVIREAYENGLESAELSLKDGSGKAADYIPELAKAKGNDFGLCVKTLGGETISHGETKKRFTIQSISKVVNLAAALKFFGFRETFSYVQMEPSGDDFNSIVKLDMVSDLPFNPMINAGAIQVVSLLSRSMDFEDLLEFARELCMDDDIELNEAVYRSESETGDRNRAIAYLLKSKGILQGDPEKTLDMYFKMCSLNVTAESLANLGKKLANDGVCIKTGKRFMSSQTARIVKTLMLTCGMYDGSGTFAIRVGIPTKSGVGGGLLSVSDKRAGIGVFGPALDAQGNSIAGCKLLREISNVLRLNLFYDPEWNKEDHGDTVVSRLIESSVGI